MPSRFGLPLAALAVACLTSCGGTAPDPAQTQNVAKDEYFVYVGTYTRGESEGIYAYRFDAAAGKLTSVGLVGEIPEPSFLAVHPNTDYLYAVSETENYDDEGSGSVSAFRIDKATGKLTLLNTVSSKGAWPCHLNLDASGKMLAVANYKSGVVASFPVNQDGSLGEAVTVNQNSGTNITEPEQGPLSHSVDFSPDNRFLISSDAGTDQVLIFRAHPESGSIEANDPAFAKVKDGAGPRHFAFHPSGNYGYVINESGSTVTAFAYDAAAGRLTELQTLSTLPEDFTGRNSTAEILIHESGKFLYGSNRGHNSIAVFSVDSTDGSLTLVEHVSSGGERPRSFGIDPTGQYLFGANQGTNNIVIFRIDQQTGRLTPTGEEINVDSPVCVKYVKVG